MPRPSRSRSRSPSRKKSKHKKKESSKRRHKKDKRRSRSTSTSTSSRSRSRSRSLSPASARRLVKAAKRFLKDRLKGGEAPPTRSLPPFPAPGDPLLPPGAPPPPPVGAADYFARSREFAAWLADARGLAAADLPSAEARALFEGPFAATWNGRALPARFYDGTVADAPGHAVRTAHKWGLAKGSTGPALASAAEEAAAWAAARDAKAAGRAAAAGAVRATHRARLEEAAPRPDPGSHEARQAARSGRALAGADRAASPDGPPAAALMGGGDSFEAARARERAAAAWRDRRDAERNAGLSAKAAAAKEAEDAKMAAFRALVATGPITIPKRAPPPPE